LVKTPYVSLPNLLAGREIVTELLQHDCVPDKLAASIMPLLEDSPQTDELKQTFLNLHQSIRCGADEQAAQAVLELARA
jgi:lipid-A-disaccharide synthase